MSLSTNAPVKLDPRVKALQDIKEYVRNWRRGPLKDFSIDYRWIENRAQRGIREGAFADAIGAARRKR